MATIVRRRVNEATGGLGTILAFLLFVVSLVLVVMFSSFAANTRSTHDDSIEHAKLCAEGAKAFRETNNPNLIGCQTVCLR